MAKQGFTAATLRNRVLTNHIYYKNGSVKSVCVSTVLNFFGVSPSEYNYTSSNKNRHVYESILRRFGYSVSSVNSYIGLKKSKSTLGEVRRSVKKFAKSKGHYFLVVCEQKKTAHLVLINGAGEIVIDTAPTRRWKVSSVKRVKMW